MGYLPNLRCFCKQYRRLAHTNLLQEPEGGVGSHCTEGWRICFGTPVWDSVEGQQGYLRPLVKADIITPQMISTIDDFRGTSHPPQYKRPISCLVIHLEIQVICLERAQKDHSTLRIRLKQQHHILQESQNNNKSL